MAVKLSSTITGIGASVLLSGAMLLGTADTALASTPSAPANATPTSVQTSVLPSRPLPCPRGRHWRERWYDNHGWWDGHHRWQRGRWHNPGCY